MGGMGGMGPGGPGKKDEKKEAPKKKKFEPKPLTRYVSAEVNQCIHGSVRNGAHRFLFERRLQGWQEKEEEQGRGGLGQVAEGVPYREMQVAANEVGTNQGLLAHGARIHR